MSERATACVMVFVGLGFALGQLGWLDSGSELLYGLTELTLLVLVLSRKYA